MRDSTFAIFLAATKPLEGVCTWMYTDRLGLVTTGIGNLIDPIGGATDLPWIHMGTGARAGFDEVVAAWQKVKGSGLGSLGGGSRQVQALTDLRLVESDVDALVAAKCGENDTALAAHFPNWEELPDEAQAGALMLAWACGDAAVDEPGALHFPKFAAALAAGDFATCAIECVMPAAANPGNNLTARNKATAALFLTAAASRADT
jgi:GH24 family phage-related lysozyme (muramidase)